MVEEGIAFKEKINGRVKNQIKLYYNDSDFLAFL